VGAFKIKCRGRTVVISRALVLLLPGMNQLHRELRRFSTPTLYPTSFSLFKCVTEKFFIKVNLKGIVRPFKLGPDKAPSIRCNKLEAQQVFIYLFIYLKGLSHKIDFKNFDKNLQNLAYLRDAAGF
jgi:hypothetical protein